MAVVSDLMVEKLQKLKGYIRWRSRGLTAAASDLASIVLLFYLESGDLQLLINRIIPKQKTPIEVV